MAIDWTDPHAVLAYATSLSSTSNTSTALYTSPPVTAKPQPKPKRRGRDPMRAAIRLVRLRKQGPAADPDSQWLQDFEWPLRWQRSTDFGYKHFLFATRNRDNDAGFFSGFNYTLCQDCKRSVWLPLALHQPNRRVCATCLAAYTSRCHDCMQPYRPNQMIHLQGLDYELCADCSPSYQLCADCAVWTRERHRHAERNPCCVAPHLDDWVIHAPGLDNGIDIHPDEHIILPSTVEHSNLFTNYEAFITRIQHNIYAYSRNNFNHGIQRGAWQLHFLLDIGNEITNNDGGWLRRLERAAYKLHDTKLAPALKEEIGAEIARYTPNTLPTNLTITRDFNQAPALYANARSCWWTDYKDARCQLKSIGGLALRVWDETWNKCVGRAWLLPLIVAPPPEPAPAPEEPLNRTTHCNACHEELKPYCNNCAIPVPQQRESCIRCRSRHAVTPFAWCASCGCVARSEHTYNLYYSDKPRQPQPATHLPTHDLEAATHWIQFNEYGTLTKQHTRIFERLINLKPKRISIGNTSPRSIGLYMNSEIAYVYAEPDILANTAQIILVTNWRHA